MLLLEDQEIRKLFSMEDCIDAMAQGFSAHAAGQTTNQPRSVYSTVSPTQELKYISNIISGAVPSVGMAAVRVASSLVWGGTKGDESDVKKREYRRTIPRDTSLVLLHNMETGHLEAILHNVYLSDLRVGATTALAMKHLSREDSTVLGMLGSGPQAKINLEGICQVRNIREVKVYSPTPEHRESFAAEMRENLGITVTAVDNTEAAIKGVDILCCATNTLSDPVFDGHTLEPGQTVTTITNSDPAAYRTEADETTFVRSDLIVINDRNAVVPNNQIELLGPIERGIISWDKVSELGQVVSGNVPGRSNADEIIYYKNNTGMALQWVVPGAEVVQRARAAGVGRELPSDWFSTDMSS